ncbi:MAG TPA: hypothetical protein VOA80_03995, partial [Thermoanaerobaculia bacterium]|nr:hypothetical protein [Thermoanaerobaculia bacterium]
PAAPLTAGPGDRGRPDAGPSGTSAAVADAAMAALGGQAAWDRVHFLRFTWGVDTHYWDKWTGRHRLEGKTRDGSIVVLDNVNTRQGKAYVDGKEAAGETGARLLEFSYSAWNHDTDWLLMPYKLKDRGVNLSYVGQQQVDGKSYDEISITFDRGMRVDLTYLVWFNRDTHLMDRWAVLAVGQRREARLGIWLCQGWQRYGNIQLAPRRVQPDTRTLEFSNILVAATMPDAVFTSQAPVPGDRGRPAGPSAGTSAAVADAAMAALGGQGAWDRVHFLRFTLGAYTHYWDKWTGRHRLDGRTRDGSIVVLDDVNTRQGRAYVDGKEAAGETGARMLRSSYTDWNNVSDWLLMPYKLKDRGVKLSYVGQQQVDGRNYDEISISFDRGVPGDPSYFAWFNRDTHLMDRWAILLVGQRRDAPASVWLCQGWQRYGNIQLAPRYVQPDTRKTIEFSNILVAATMPEAVFTSQQPVPPIKAQGGGAATALGLGKP